MDLNYSTSFKGEEGRYLGLQRIAQLLCHAPAKLFGLAGAAAAP